MTKRERSAPAWVDKPAERNWSEAEESSLRLWIALARCYSSFAKAVSTKVQEYGLTTPQFGVLEALYHLGPLSLGELADKLLVTGGNVTYVMDRLEDQGLVCRERSPHDRRVIRAKLTEVGWGRIADVFDSHADFIHGLTRHLTPQEREDARYLLKKLGRGVMNSDI